MSILYTILSILCNPLLCAIVGLSAGLLFGLIAVIITRDLVKSVWIGSSGALLVITPWIILLIALNIPLNPPLSYALPPDYIWFWLLFGIGCFVCWLIDTVLLFLIWRKK